MGRSYGTQNLFCEPHPPVAWSALNELTSVKKFGVFGKAGFSAWIFNSSKETDDGTVSTKDFETCWQDFEDNRWPLHAGSWDYLAC